MHRRVAQPRPHARTTRHLRQPKVRQQHPTLPIKQDVAGLHVPVHRIQGVQRRQPRRRLPRNPHRRRHIQRPAYLPRLGHPIRQAAACRVRHHQHQRTLNLLEVIHRDHVVSSLQACT
jgi:hypothetical protein